MKKAKLIAILALLFASSAGFAKTSTTQDLMQRKLKNAQGLLAGLALENFDVILTNAQNLREISKAATWHKIDTPAYRHYASSFENTTHNMIEQAKAKNLEGVAMSYIGLTFACMQCHNEVRGKNKKK